MIKTPYLLFLGDAPDGLAAKVAQGIYDWRPDNAVGQFRMDGCKADLGLTDMSLTEGQGRRGQDTVVIGVANRGGVISPAWKKVLVEAALEEGFDLASRAAQPAERRAGPGGGGRGLWPASPA